LNESDTYVNGINVINELISLINNIRPTLSSEEKKQTAVAYASVGYRALTMAASKAEDRNLDYIVSLQNQLENALKIKCQIDMNEISKLQEKSQSREQTTLSSVSSEDNMGKSEEKPQTSTLKQIIDAMPAYTKIFTEGWHNLEGNAEKRVKDTVEFVKNEKDNQKKFQSALHYAQQMIKIS